MRTVCPQCGTRYDDWDHGGDDEEDLYVASVQKCTGCEVIADKQQDLERHGGSLNGMKVALVPASIQAALETERQMNRAQRGLRAWDDDE